MTSSRLQAKEQNLEKYNTFETAYAYRSIKSQLHTTGL